MTTTTATAENDKDNPLASLRFSYRQAAKMMNKDPRAVAEIARSRGLELPEGKPLDVKGYRKIARYLGVASRFISL